MAKRDPIVSKVWKIVNKKRRYVGIRKSGRWTFLKTPNPSKAPSKAKKKGSKTSKKNSVRKLFGNVGWKGMIVGTAVLTAAKYLAKRFAPIPPRYVDGVSMIGASFVPVSGVKNLRSAGMMDVGSEFLSDIFIGGLGQTTVRGYDV